MELREEIDGIDRQIAELFVRRMGIAEEVAEYKLSVGKAVFDRERECAKLAALASYGTTPFLANGIRELFVQIMAVSRKRQYQLITERGGCVKPDFKQVDGLDYKNAAIVFQGVEGAYSQLALKEYFGPAANGVHVETWRDAMEAIAGGEAACAVLPIENSSTGIVSENFDLLAEYDNCIIGEQIIRANHCLMGVPGAKLSDITDVYSHPQALMQCSKYLDAHTGWEKHSAENTAVSAMKVQKEGKRTQAAIAGKITAEIYGLNILAEGIQNHSSNSTRFIVVAKQKVFRKDAKKISVCFEIPHVSGSLYHTLSHLIYNNLNMNKIESRPIQGRTWEYRFFIDIDGNLADGAVQNALQALWGVTVNLRILGNY